MFSIGKVLKHSTLTPHGPIIEKEVVSSLVSLSFSLSVGVCVNKKSKREKKNRENRKETE
jgi:hypothetical protein